MSLSKKASLIIYRFREKGLEVLLVNDDEDKWEIPQRTPEMEDTDALLDEERLIKLDPTEAENGTEEEAWAVEGDWHEIPSLKNMLFQDAKFLKSKIKEMEKGTYISIKEAFKKVLPHQYEFLKELKDILRDRNSLKNL